MKTVKVVVDTNSSVEGLEYPQFAYISVTGGFLERLGKLSSLCADNGLSEVREFNGPEWFSEDQYRIDLHEMSCSPDEVWFTAFIKHSDLPFYTSRIEMSTLRSIFNEANDGDVIFRLSGDPGEAEYQYAELVENVE